jgi:ParB/RepB/Spo0J family partition protein
MSTPQQRLAAKKGGKNTLEAIEKLSANYQAQHNPMLPEVQEGEVVLRKHVTEIRPNPFQHRTSFDAAGIADLTHSMRVNGQNQPIAVRKRGDGYEIIFGERRWRAAAGLDDKMIDVVVREISDTEMIFICLSENRDRKKAYDYETYRGIQFALDDGQTPDNIMERMKLDRVTLYKYMAFGALHPELKAFVHANPGAIQRNDAMDISGIFQKFGDEVPDGAVETLKGLMQKYLDREISSRGEIVKQFKAKFVQKKLRNREKLNHEFSLGMGDSKVGTMVKTPDEVRLTVLKTELSKDKLDELDKFLTSFFKVAEETSAS